MQNVTFRARLPIDSECGEYGETACVVSATVDRDGGVDDLRATEADGLRTWGEARLRTLLGRAAVEELLGRAAQEYEPETTEYETDDI